MGNGIQIFPNSNSGGGGSSSFSSLTGSPEDNAALVAFVERTPSARTLTSYNFATGVNGDWTDFGAATTHSVTGGKLVISGNGNTNFQDGTRLNLYTSRLENVRIRGKYTCTIAKGAATYGLGFGFQSVNSTAASKASFGSYLDYTTSGAFGGAPGIRRIQNTTLTNPLAFGVASLSFAANDVIEFEIAMFQNKVTVHYKNLTQTGQETQISYTYVVNTTSAAYNMPNTWQVAVFNVGNGGEVTELSLETDYPTTPDIAFVGDSLFKGYYTDTNDLNVSRHIEILMNSYYKGLTHIVAAGASDKTDDVIAGLTELVAQAPKNVILNIGTNDLGGGVAAGTYQANYQTIVNALVAGGSRVFPMLLWPRNDLDVSAVFNPWLLSTYGTGTGLNGGRALRSSYYALKAALNDGTFPLGLNDRFDDSPADGVHPSLHHQTIADAIYYGTKGLLQ